MTSDGEQIVGTIIESDGNEVPVPVSVVTPLFSDALSAVTFGEGAGDELRVEEREPDGLLRLRVKLFEEDAGKDGLMLGTVNSDGGALMLTPGPVWYLPKCEEAPHGVLIVDSMDRLQPVEGEPLEKRVEPATGDHRPDRIAVYLDGEPLGIGSLIFAVAFVRGTIAAYEKMKGEAKSADEGPEEIALAQYKTDRVFANHSLSLKVLNGIYDIAFGKPYYEIAPKGGKSGESYRLTGSVDAASRFLYEYGGNSELLKDVLETVHTLRTDRRAEGFLCNGRVWFTVNTIVEEMRRTTGGTVTAKNYPNDRQVVDAALTLASGAQVVGVKPNGDPMDVTYLINAVRRDRITFKETEYRDVWGFLPDAATINDYAREIGQAYSYPLLVSKKPLTMDEAWIDRYLRDVLNEARGRLYKVGKNKAPVVRSARVKHYEKEILWDTIFKTASPMKEPSSRQKQKIVDTFEKVLKLQADMEKHGEMREGMPLYINAHSVRNASRGRGRGKWEKLVIDCSRELRVPDIDLS